ARPALSLLERGRATLSGKREPLSVTRSGAATVDRWSTAAPGGTLDRSPAEGGVADDLDLGSASGRRAALCARVGRFQPGTPLAVDRALAGLPAADSARTLYPGDGFARNRRRQRSGAAEGERTLPHTAGAAGDGAPRDSR